MQKEIVFEIGGEGGSITILREGTRFIYEHNEFDPMEEEPPVNIIKEYPSFEKAFERIHQTYPWHMLYLQTVHANFRSFICHRLIEKLNSKSVSPQQFEYNQNRIEKKLNIELHYTGNEQDKSITWSFIENVS